MNALARIKRSCWSLGGAAGLVLLAAALGYPLAHRTLSLGGWLLVLVASVPVAFLWWPFMRRLRRFLGWLLLGIVAVGVLSAELQARSERMLGLLLLFALVWGLSRFASSLKDAFLTGYRGKDEHHQATLASSSKTPRVAVVRARSDPAAWDEVILPGEVKQELQIMQAALRDHLTLQREWGQAPPLGVILYGPPGTGKSLIARTLARSSDYALIAVSAADIMDALVGSSERAIRALFAQAREAAPCIVFIDEVDTLAARRSASGLDVGGAVRSYNNMTNQLLQEIEGFTQHARPVFTIGATNRLDVLDEALRSRLAYHLYVGLPDGEARRQLFALYTRPYRHRLACSLASLAHESEGLSGRDIHEVCRWVATYAHSGHVDEVQSSLFARAFQRLKRVDA